MIATARADWVNPLIHGADVRRPVDTSTVTRRWARAVLAEQRRTIATLLLCGERLRAAEACHVAALPDESDRECRCLCQRGLFEGPGPVVAPPPLPAGPSPLGGAADPASIPPELVPWLRRDRKKETSLFATVSHQKGTATWFVSIPIYMRAAGGPARLAPFRTEIEAVRASIAYFGPTPPVAPAHRKQGKGRHAANVPAESETSKGRKAAAREWMLLRREMLGLPPIVR